MPPCCIQDVPIRVPFSKCTVLKICRLEMCRFHVNERATPGGNYYICRYDMCLFLGCLFRAENKFLGIIFGKMTSGHKF